MKLLSSYERKILEVFAASFPHSAHYRQGRKLRKSGWDTIFPEITTDAQSKEDFLNGVEALEKRGVISINWKRFRKRDTVEALYLEDADSLYDILGTEHPDSTRLAMLTLLKTHKAQSTREKELQDYCISHLENKLPLPVSDSGQLKDILRLAACTPEEAGAFSLRGLSVHLFNHSKRIESILETTDLLSERARGEKLSSALGLLRSYPESTLAGNLCLRFSDGKRWELNGRIITLPCETARQIERIEWPGSAPALLSIENKETFYLATKILSHRFGGFLYTSGQMNRADQLLFKILQKSGVNFYHFGDLDPGGLLIFLKIYELLDGKLTPFFMDTATYNRYLVHGYPLSLQALKKLELIRIPVLEPLKYCLLEYRKGVEQEIINLL